MPSTKDSPAVESQQPLLAGASAGEIHDAAVWLAAIVENSNDAILRGPVTCPTASHDNLDFLVAKLSNSDDHLTHQQSVEIHLASVFAFASRLRYNLD